jgi:DNA-binding NarL/FixJ family response regulator
VPIRVLIVDDHVVVRAGLRAIFATAPDLVVAGEAASGAEALARVAALAPDVVLLDLVMPGMGGLEALPSLRQLCPSIQVVVVTAFDDEPSVRRALDAGAVGYLLKDARPEDFLRAVREAAAGRPFLHAAAQRYLMGRVRRERAADPLRSLTRRERDVLDRLGRARTNRAIARELGLTENTVKGHVSSVLAKLNLRRRTEAAVLAVRQGLLDGDPR